MKIENDLLNIPMPKNDRIQEPSKAEGLSSGRTQSIKVGGDGVDLGSQAGLVATAQTAGQADRTRMVQTLRALVQSGQYQVDNAALSSSMITSAQFGD